MRLSCTSDVGVLDDLVALHRDGAAAAQQNRAPRRIAVADHGDAHLVGQVGRLRLGRVALGAVRLGAGRGARRNDRRAVTPRREQLGARRRLHGIVDDLRAIEIVRPDRVGQRPHDLLAVGRPRRELTADVVELLHRHDGVRRIGDRHRGRRRADLWHRDEIDVHADVRDRLIAGGRHHDERRRRCLRSGIRLVRIVDRGHHVCRTAADPALRFVVDETRVERHRVAARRRHGRHGAGDLDVRAQVGAVPAERDETIARTVRVDAIGVRREVRIAEARGRHDERRVAAGGGNPHEVRRRRAEEGGTGVLHLARGGAVDDDPVAVRRPGEIRIEPGGARELRDRRLAAAGRACPGRAHDLAAALIAPRHVRDRLRVGRPRRAELPDVRLRHPLRGAAREVHHVDAVEGRECELLAVGRRGDVTGLVRRERAFVSTR